MKHRFVKGSPEAKAFMARLRAMQGRGSARRMRVKNAPRTGTRAALDAEAAAVGLSVDTWSPGDGVTRYRFFTFGQGDYFAHSQKAVGTVKGLKAAFKFVAQHGRGGNPPLLVIGNPPSGPVDFDAARELAIFIENERSLSPDSPDNTQGRAIVANLYRKWYAGKYDHEKAITLWMYLMETAARQYTDQFGTPGQPIDMIFNRNTRLEVARQFRDDFEQKMASGEYPHVWVRSVVPKKYHSKLPPMGNPAEPPITVPLRGWNVLAHEYQGMLMPVKYGNRTQALHKASQLGAPWEVLPSLPPSRGFKVGYKQIQLPGLMGNPGASFEDWMSQVDRIVWQKAGVSVHDLPDVPYRDWYDDGVSPKGAASRAIRAAGSEENPGASARGVRSPWAVCTAAVGRKDRAKYERCVQKVKARMQRVGNPAHGIPPHVANDPRFKAALKMYRRMHGSGPVEIRSVKVPKGYPKFLVSYGKAPHAVYDAAKRSNKGKRIHQFGEGGGSQPWLVTAPGREKFLSYVGGTFRAKNWIFK